MRKALQKYIFQYLCSKICAPRKSKPKFTKFGEQVSIGQTPNAVKFRCARTRIVRDICCPKFVLPKSGLKFTKMTCYAQMPLIVPNFIALVQTMYEKSVTKIFYTFSILDLRGGLSAPQFTNLGPVVQQGPRYGCAKFRLVLKTRLRDIRCQISSILLIV